jgi:hypothetical protein
LAPSITYDDIVTIIGATTSGIMPTRTLHYYEDSLNEATVQMHIDSANAYMRFFLGDELWDSSTPATAGAVERGALLYAAANVLSVLSGGLMISGFNVTMSDLSLGRSERFTVYHNLIVDFTSEAEALAIQLTQFRLAKTGGQAR